MPQSREQQNEYHRAWYQKNREKELERVRRWREKTDYNLNRRNAYRKAKGLALVNQKGEFVVAFD